MSDTVRQYEERAERARARVDLQLEHLQARMAPQALADEAIGALKRSTYAKLADDVVAAVRRNPFPLVLAGAALAIFATQLAEERARRRPDAGWRRPVDGPYPPHHNLPDDLEKEPAVAPTDAYPADSVGNRGRAPGGAARLHPEPASPLRRSA